MASGNANDSNASNMASRYSKAVLNQRESRNAQEVKASRLKNPGDHRALLHDVFSGTGIVAQAGALMLAGLIWRGILTHNINIFSFHPLFNSTALLLMSQATLLLQPTQTGTQKYRGAWAHFLLNISANIALLSGLAVMETIKSERPDTRWRSAHAVMGGMTYALIALQTVVGIVQVFLPKLLGGERNAHKVIKYHRVMGYSILAMALMTVIAATRTGYNLRVLHIPTGGVLGAIALIALGVGMRIERAKLPGWNPVPGRAKLK